MSGLAAKSRVATPPQSEAVMRFPSQRVRKAVTKPGVPAAPWGPSWTKEHKSERERWAVKQLAGLLAEMEVPPIDEAVRQRLQRLIYLHGPEHVTLLIRTITESEGNEDALIEPIINAVSWVMVRRRDWTDKGLAWLEAHDAIPLLAILETMRGLDLFQETSLAHHLSLVLSNKLRKILEPPPPPPPPPKPKRKYTRRKPKADGIAHGLEQPDVSNVMDER
ncbi:hypothetical protein [Bradyrhizobium sp. JYMT SZCCT0180]|uniref:hypothetical protein n=1 Tax=Bradyrhizobium sp. JYMT SZCCT0180 TaxID=2807666 RepID=UPI001BAAA010|nr:hypothetical protein [Bradyrhizobium sp. JYMT SZCCT0180]MBR1211109.1 hypothetical protein [Bradyrhizobium sp. JYMT SZCCT0180]